MPPKLGNQSSAWGSVWSNYQDQFVKPTTASSTAINYTNEFYNPIGRTVAQLEELQMQVDKLVFDFENTLEIALKQVEMADYKDRIQNDFKAIIDRKLTEIITVAEGTYKALNERVNNYEQWANEKLAKIDEEIKKREQVLKKIDFLAQELGYQMDIAQKSF